MHTELTIVVPTYNEKDNVEFLIKALKTAIDSAIQWKVIFVDDNSPDGTSDIVRKIASNDSCIELIQRKSKDGLSSACIEGIKHSNSPYICIMDADLQHDEKIIPVMLRALKHDDVELVVASRYVKNGSTGGLPWHRVFVSKIAVYMSNLFIRHKIIHLPID